MVGIVPYQTRWGGEFAQLGAKLRQALGDLALRIDHIGSTSVPGLTAKDVIDIQVTVASFESFDAVASALAGIGYTMREDVKWDHHPGDSRWSQELEYHPDWEKRLFHEPQGQRPVNLHVRAAGRANQRYALLFRDYLRSHQDVASAYGIFKQRLALLVQGDGHVYSETKDPVCDIIMGGAEEWARVTGWKLGPSDA